MQIQWTIEARADMQDEGKKLAMQRVVKEAAAHISAMLIMLQDGQKPQVVCFSDDFFAGHEEISLLPDTIGQALAEHEQTASDDKPEDTGLSQEMIDAARQMQVDNLR